MITFIGKDTAFKVVWNCSAQSYTVYKDNQVLVANKFKFSEVQPYLDLEPTKKALCQTLNALYALILRVIA